MKLTATSEKAEEGDRETGRPFSLKQYLRIGAGSYMEIETLKVSQLIPYKNNPRRNDDSVDAVAESIREFGFKVPIIVDRKNVVVCGHTRLKAAKKLKMKEVPCIRADDLTDEQIRAFRLADNKVSESSVWDFDKLDDELGNIFDLDMSRFGFNLVKED